MDVSFWVGVAAIGMDVIGEWRARVGHADWVRIAVEHRVYAARTLVWALEREGLAVLARGLEARTCLHFFGPYIPIELLVHAGEEERAAAIVERTTSG